jgi:ribosome-binding protein aMBF1 (putative translation factor)
MKCFVCGYRIEGGRLRWVRVNDHEEWVCSSCRDLIGVEPNEDECEADHEGDQR